jgi:sporulation protein YlmC with PRC-barrel domain
MLWQDCPARVILMYMLQLSTAFVNRSVLSLRSGTQVGTTLGPIINPNNLKIEGFYCQVRGNKQELVLLSQDIRDLIPQGFVINDEDELSVPEELIRLKDIMEFHFDLMGKLVVTSSGDKIGKVSDYAADTQSMFIHKLYVSQSLLKHFASGNLGVDRTQIVEVTPRTIIINDLEQKVPVAHAGAMA